MIKFRGWISTALVMVLVAILFAVAVMVHAGNPADPAGLGFAALGVGVCVQLLDIRAGHRLQAVHSLGALISMGVVTFVFAVTGGMSSPFLALLLVGALVTGNYGGPRLIVLAFGLYAGLMSMLVVLDAGELLPKAAGFTSPWWTFASLIAGALVGFTSNLAAQLARNVARTALHAARDDAEARRKEAERALADLRGAQEQMIVQEKMASLGGLVAGVAHEVNTPVGLIVTGASQLQEEVGILADQLGRNAMKRSDLEGFLRSADEICRLLQANGRRAADLIGSFKSVAVDQASGERRLFELKEYVREVVASLSPKLRGSGHVVKLEVEAGLLVDGYPGPFSQVITNLLLNSMLHGYGPGQAGTMSITARRAGDSVELVYEDDGVGIPRELWTRVFDPFFTTKRGQGGSGLGLHLVWTIVTGTLGGKVRVEAPPSGQGARFVLTLPLSAPVRTTDVPPEP